MKDHPEAGGSRLAAYKEFPVLVKLIDAGDNLSVQVHPDDAYARAHEGQAGKEEMWYVVDAAEDAVLYIGLKEKMSPEAFDEAIKEEKLLDHLNAVKVRAGEHYFIPAGTLHAIGKGCLLAEVQQSSNVTYRVYDYGRRDAWGRKRPLHIEQAKEVCSLEKAEFPKQKPSGCLAEGKSFLVDLIKVKGEAELSADEESFSHLLLVKGKLQLEDAGKTSEAKPGDGFFFPARGGRIRLKGEGDILRTRLP